jgi:signal transduction histidine kinase
MPQKIPVVLLTYTAFLGLMVAFILPGLPYINDLFSTVGFDPHGHCFLWKPEILRLYLISDTLIGTSYFAISGLLIYMVFRYNLPFRTVFIAFGAFIVTCGLTHFMDMWTLWNPTYWLSGYTKFITAIASTATAVMLPPMLPKVNGLVNAARQSQERKKSLEELNVKLQAEIAENQRLVGVLRENETKLIESYERERQVNELQSRIITTISHEFRTPMTVIQTSAELMLRYADKISPENRAERLNLIKQEVKVMTGLLEDMLTIGKMEEGKQDLELAPVELDTFCARFVDDIRGITEAKHTIEYTSTGDCGEVMLDKRLLAQMLTNLLGNAVKYSPNGGIIHLWLACDTENAIFIVGDQGIGIPSSEQADIFEKFQRGSNVSTISGTGMGLAIVRNAVELHNGTIQVQSEEGKGTTFTVRLPLVQPEALHTI